MKKLKHLIFYPLLIIILLWACNNNSVFNKYNHIPDKGWHKDSTIAFSVPVTDTLGNHNLYINVRNDISYNYSNLWLFIDINQPGDVIVTDTFEIALAEPSGEWLGSGFGGIKTNQILYKGSVYFPVSGVYKIEIQHGMREEVLEGITDIGLRVE